jgi:hypothetical protein
MFLSENLISGSLLAVKLCETLILVYPALHLLIALKIIFIGSVDFYC